MPQQDPALFKEAGDIDPFGLVVHRNHPATHDGVLFDARQLFGNRVHAQRVPDPFLDFGPFQQ